MIVQWLQSLTYSTLQVLHNGSEVGAKLFNQDVVLGDVHVTSVKDLGYTGLVGGN